MTKSNVEPAPRYELRDPRAESRASSMSFAVSYASTVAGLDDVAIRALSTLGHDGETERLPEISFRHWRDEAIRKLAKAMKAGATPADVAGEIERYITSAWRHERDREPPADAPEKRKLLWRIAQLGGGVTLVDRQVRTILSRRDPNS